MNKVLFNSEDWFVQDAPVKGFARNEKGTLVLTVERQRVDGTPYDWNLYVPAIDQFAALEDVLANADLGELKFTGGRRGGYAQVVLGY